MIRYAGNHYSVPWRLVGELLPVRITETEQFVYDHHIQQQARHLLLTGPAGKADMIGEPMAKLTAEPVGAAGFEPAGSPRSPS